MSKNKINVRLDQLFSGIHENQEVPRSGLQEYPIAGFAWETDRNGLYSTCDEGVRQVLGLDPTAMIGNPLVSAFIAADDQSRFREALHSQEFPVSVELSGMDTQYHEVYVRFTIFQKLDADGKPAGFRGYCEKLEKTISSGQKKKKTAKLKPTAPLQADKTGSLERLKPTEEELISLGLNTSPLDGISAELESKAATSKSEKPKKKGSTNKLGDTGKITTGRLKDAQTETGKLEAKTPPTGQQSKDKKVKTKTSPLALNDAETGQLDVELPASISRLNGLSIIDQRISPSNSVWTAQAQEGYEKNKLVSISSTDGTPAILSIPLYLRNEKSGLIEIVDNHPDRVWSAEERGLLKEVAHQLGLALENNQLNTTLQKELAERAKAERETLRRNKDLSNLNLLGQQLNQLANRKPLFETIAEMTKKIMGVENLLLTLHDQEYGQLSFPACVVNGINVSLPPRPPQNGYLEDILNNHEPLLINRNLAKTLQGQKFDHTNYLPYSLLAVPLVIGEQVLGVLSVYDYQNEDAFDQMQLELLSSVASQAAIALENVNLFTEINEALKLIENRQLVQSNVTKAVAELSSKGSEAISFLLQSLSQATLSDRVFYARGVESPEGEYVWQAQACHLSGDNKRFLDEQAIAQIKFNDHPKWATRLRANGWHACSIHDANDDEKKYLTDHHLQSLLLLAVHREYEPVGFIALERITSPQDWKPEEIDILRIAGDALSNTLLRENLLEQLRTSLNETENLYSTSHQLALAENMQEMIYAVLSGFSSQTIEQGEIVLFDYNLEGKLSRITTVSHYSNAQVASTSKLGQAYPVQLYESLFSSQLPVYYDLVGNAPLSEELRKALENDSIRSLAVLPLWSNNVQIGALLLQSAKEHHFSALEIRSYPPLADQMASAIQNLRLFESTQAALAETELLYKISSGISKSSSLDELTLLVGENVIPTGCSTLHLYLVSTEQPSDVLEFNHSGAYSQHDLTLPVKRISANALPFLKLPGSVPIVVSNWAEAGYSAEAQTFLKSLGLQSFVVIPLQTSDNPVGFMIAGAQTIIEMDVKEVHTLQIIGNSISVAIERQRLLYEAQRRAIELQTAAEIARDTTSTLSQEILLDRIVNLLKDRFGYYHCSIFLLDETNTYAVIQESTGEAGKLMKQNKHKLAVGSKSVIGTCIASGQVVIVNDANLSPVFYPNPLLLETRSEMGIPLKIGGRIIGALDLQSTAINAFSENEVAVIKILSDQISVAIENARAYALSQQAVQEMRELDRVKSQFLANMSHELRTPLNSVIGFSRVILKGIDGPINKVQEQDITSIYNSGMNLLNMINEILDLSKIEAGKMELQLEDINIAEVIHKAVSTATGLIKDKPIQLIEKLPDNLPSVKADSIKIGQVVLNLLSNAIKFTDKGTVTIEAALSQGANLNAELKILVSDTGTGIAPADQAKLFQRFSQVDDSPTRKTGGTGLGLSISRSLIELHGGKIGLQSSEPGKGSVFFFTLPLSHFIIGLDASQAGHGENVILSIDDDPQVIALYERYLKNYGFEVVGLTNPARSVEKAVELKPFAITLDIMMPQVDGWQVLQDLRQDERTRDIPILVCSILEEEEKGFSLGASEYLVKPFLQGDLINAIRRIHKDDSALQVLIIDEDQNDLKLVKKMVEGEPGFHPILAQGGKTALEILNNLTPDLIILDLFMSDMNGFELLDRFKSEPRWSQIPVILLTGADLTPEQKNQLAESSKALSTHGLLKENDILKNMEEALQKIKPLASKPEPKAE